MNPILVVARNTFRQTVRQRLFFNVLVFGVGMLLLGMVMGNITFGYPDRVVRSIGLTGIALALDLVGLLVGVSLIHQEIDKKTLFVVLTRPLHRWQYALGRYLGLVATLVVAGAGLFAVFGFTLFLVRGSPQSGDVMAVGVAVVEAALIGGVGLVLSAFSTPTLSAGIGLGIWLAGATTDDLVRLTEAAGGPPHMIAKVIYYVLPALARFNFRDVVIYSQSVPLPEYLAACGYGVAYSTMLVAVASIILSRREMV